MFGVGIALEIAPGDLSLPVVGNRRETMRHAAVKGEGRPRRRCEEEGVEPRQQPRQQQRGEEDDGGLDSLYHKSVIFVLILTPLLETINREQREEQYAQ